MKARSVSLSRHLFFNCLFGCIIGVVVLHPFSVYVFDITENRKHAVSLSELFSLKHLIMSGYFSLLGGVIGLLRGFYTHKRSQLFKRIRYLSITDELTSLYNRRYFMDRLGEEIERARRYTG